MITVDMIRSRRSRSWRDSCRRIPFATFCGPLRSFLDFSFVPLDFSCGISAVRSMDVNGTAIGAKGTFVICQTVLGGGAGLGNRCHGTAAKISTNWPIA